MTPPSPSPRALRLPKFVSKCANALKAYLEAELNGPIADLLAEYEQVGKPSFELVFEEKHGLTHGGYDLTVRRDGFAIVVIEVDGPHHFYLCPGIYGYDPNDMDGKKQLTRTVASDLAKEKNLKEKNLPLIRVSSEHVVIEEVQTWVVEQIIGGDELLVCYETETVKPYSGGQTAYSKARAQAE